MNHKILRNRARFNEECSILVRRRKQHVGVRRETSRTLRNKKRESLKDQISKLETKSKHINIKELCRGINEFKQGYKPRTHSIKDENGTVDRWKDYFSKLVADQFNEPEVRTAEPFIVEPSLNV